MGRPVQFAMAWTKLQNLLDVLTRPSKQLIDPDQRQRARMLASTSAALIVGASILFSIWIALLPYYVENRVIAVVTLVMLCAVYALSRTRAYSLGAGMLVGSIFFLVLAIIITAPGSGVEQMQTLYFLILAIMFSYFFLSRPAIALVIVSSVGVIGWFFATRPIYAPIMYAFMVFFVITVLLGAVFTVLNHSYRSQLAQSEERYRSAVSVLSEGIVMHAADGSIVASNAAAADILGLTEQQLHGRDSFDPRWRAVREDGSEFRGEDHPAMVTLRTGQPQTEVVMGVHRPTGDLRWITITSKPLIENKGVVVSFTDITERRTAEQTLTQFVDDMRALQLLHLELSEVRDLDELLKQMIQQSQQRLGLERVGLLLLSDDGQHLLGTYGTGPDGALRDERYYTERITDDHWTLPILETPNHVQLQTEATLFDDGHMVGTGWAAQSALWNGERAIGYLVIDNFVTKRPPRLYERELLSILGSTFGHLIERKRSELALIESEQRQRALLTALPDLVFRLNADGIYLDLHAPNEGDLVAAPEQIIGHRIDQLLPPNVSAKLLRALDRVMQTGEEQLVEYSLEIGGVVKDFEARMVAAQPGEALTIVRNVTERKRAQQREFDLALATTRVQLLQQFIEKASHEFRTPLAIVNSSAYLMARTLEPHTRQQRAEVIHQQVDRLIKMLDMLFLLSRLESGVELELLLIDLAWLITNVCQAAVNMHGERPQLVLKLEPHLPRVMAHAAYLQTALMQILDNAYRFTPPDGTITIWVRVCEQHLCIEVQDTGCGIRPEDLPHIFDMFWQQTPTDASPGLGIGLPIARRIVQLHYGDIMAQSILGAGTTLRILLPVAELEAASLNQPE
jgi:PAS domain S-box-containing protein